MCLEANDDILVLGECRALFSLSKEFSKLNWNGSAGQNFLWVEVMRLKALCLHGAGEKQFLAGCGISLFSQVYGWFGVLMQNIGLVLTVS